LLERTIGDWAPTLRTALVLVTLFIAAAVAVAWTLGLDGLLLVLALGIVLTRMDAVGR
jgi:hypothetical protein